MSFFGRNIKKIRTVKKLSQAAFAEIFSLKRGSIGAYEEGRAEAKIDTIINIAAYFKLSLEQLLTNELTINEIYHLDSINKKLYNSLSDKKECKIPFVSIANKNKFIQNYNNNDFLESLASLSLPDLKQYDIAFESFDSSMLGMYSGIKQGDILIARKIEFKDIENLQEHSVVLVLYENDLVIGIPEQKNKELILNPLNLNFQKYYIKINGIKRLWQIRKIITDSFIKEEIIEQRIKQLEDKFITLNNQ